LRSSATSAASAFERLAARRERRHEPDGAQVPFTGTGTLVYSAANSTTFDNSPALSQLETITATITAAGQSGSFNTMVTDFYAPSSYAFLGE
jgi:hypothetical protein